MNRYLLITLLVMPFCAEAQKYLVEFKDKANSPYAISKPTDFLSARAVTRRSKQNIYITERDLPPNPTYISQVIAAGGKVLYKSRWMNGVVVEATDAVIATILKLSFVKGIDGNLLLKNLRQSSDNQLNNLTKAEEILSVTDLGASKTQLEMLGVDKMFAAGFHGEGINIAVLDNGFQNATSLSFFSTLFAEKRVIDTYDFVGNKKDVYDVGSHGTHCLSCLAAFEDGKIVGTAYKANYFLYHTEDDNSETRLEEANWLVAAERADSAGVDVISTSLGYNEFDNSLQDYTYQDLNGRKSLVTRAAEAATSVGMLVVVAAGNEATSAWHYITVPADADSIIAVGAVTATGLHSSFSSVGPSADGRIKPDLAAMGTGTTIGLPTNTVSSGSGTSYATPLMAGLAAGLWQSFPQMTNQQVRNYLIKSGSQFKTPDNILGYGIPNFQTAYDAAKKDLILSNEELEFRNLIKIYPNPVKDFSEIHIVIAESSPNVSYELLLVDSSGKQLWNGATKEKDFYLPISSKNFIDGEYFLKIYGNKNLSTSYKIVLVNQ